MSYHNIDLEKSVLASLMSIENSLEHVSSIIDTSDFVADRHKSLYRGIKELHAEGLPYDNVMLHDWITANKLVEATGGDGYIADILSESPSTLFNLAAYARRIKELSQYRDIDGLLVQMRENLKHNEASLEVKVNDSIEQLIKVIDTSKVSGGAKTVGSMMDRFFEDLVAASSGEIIPFKPTGFEEIDARVPIQNGDLVIIGARPSMGKTTYGQTMVQNMVENDMYTDENGNYKRRAGVFFSIEMTDASVVQRFMASKAGVKLQRIRSGAGLDVDDWSGLNDTVKNYRDEYPMFIESQTGMSIAQMRTTLN